MGAPILVRRSALLVDVAALSTAKALLAVWLLHRGFSHISDDDYSRVVIAELFAGAPRLDPSGTSWLPFPFWLTGGVMLAVGRSLAVARGVAVVLGVLSIAPVYAALRSIGATRVVAAVVVAIGIMMPWSAWLSVATVPDGYCGALIAAGALSLGAGGDRRLGAASLLVASLSRYEAWPVCAVFACVCAGGSLGRVPRRARIEALAAALVAAAGPLLWMLWNAHSHGSATHFLARVATYRQRIGASGGPLAEKILDYPRGIVAFAPHALFLGAIGLASLGERAMRRRWLAPLAATLALVAFLVVGDVADGAPTHHPERALLAVAWMLAAFGVDAARALAARWAWAKPQREMFVVGAAVACGVAWTAYVADEWDEFPGRSALESRVAQVQHGLQMRARGVARFEVTPCAYEHFALLAAYGAPERAITKPASPREDARQDVTNECPAVVELASAVTAPE